MKRRSMLWLALVSLAAQQNAVGAESTKDVRVRCLSGKCYLRERQSLWNLQVDPGREVTAHAGDVVVGLGEKTAIEIVFPDGTRSYLKKTGLLRIVPGRKETVLAQGEETLASKGQFRELQDASRGKNLFFIGNFAAKLIAPPVESPILSSSFPLNLKAAFRVEGTPQNQTAMAVWHFYPKGENPSSSNQVEFELDKSESDLWVAVLRVSKPAEYVLVPRSGLETGGFSVIVKTDDALEAEVQNLLDKARSDSDATFEIRSDGP